MLTDQLKQALEQAVKQYAESLCVLEKGNMESVFPTGWPEIYLEQPAQPVHGDYSTNAAMKLAKILHRPPMEIAEGIRKQLEADAAAFPIIRHVETAAPGFLNLFINWPVWDRMNLASIPDPARSQEKVLIEHTSINPNKAAHIGHLRNSCIGDTIGRLLKRTGYQVEVHNYIDDLGNQLADTVVGLQRVPAEQSHDRFGDFCWEIYSEINRQYARHPEMQEERAKVLHALEEGTGNIAWLGQLVAERNVREHVEEMETFGIRYDVLVWESSILREGLWEDAFAMLRKSPLFVKEEAGKLAGCWVLKDHDNVNSDSLPDNEYSSEKVLVRSNGILTYTAKDIAYHLWKFGLLERKFRYRRFADGLWTTASIGQHEAYGNADRVINVIDRRQEYPQAIVKLALEQLGFEQQAARLQHVGYGVVSLSPMTAERLGIDTSDGRKSYPMSGRQGIGVKVQDFLKEMETVIEGKRSRNTGLSSREIAASAMRYYLLRYALQTEIIFDVDQATEISGNTGVYLLYSYARAASILAKATNEGAPADISPMNEPYSGNRDSSFSGLYSDFDEKQGTLPVSALPDPLPPLSLPESTLLRHLAYWPETLEAAAAELNPGTLCTYAYELASLFNNFYAVCPILKASPEEQKVRLWITARFQATMEDALSVLGLPAPEQM